MVQLSGIAKPLYEHTTDKYLIAATSQELPLYSLEQKTYSSQFYSQGTIKIISQEEFTQKLDATTAFRILLSKAQWSALDIETQSKLTQKDCNKKRCSYHFIPLN